MAVVDLRGYWGWRGLMALSVFFVGFGIATALLGSLPPASIWGSWVGQHIYGGPMPERGQALFDFMRGPLGGTMAGFYMLQCVLVAIPMRRGERWAAVAIVGGTATWFAVDTAASIAHGAWFNVWLINVPAALLTALSIWAWCRARRAAMRATHRSH